jgi:calmodulin
MRRAPRQGFVKALAGEGEGGGTAVGGQAGELAAEEIDAMFDKYDPDGSGTLDMDEVQALLAGEGFDVDADYLGGLFDAFDTDGSGDIDRAEFQVLCAAVLGRAVGDDTDAGHTIDSPWFWMALRYKVMEPPEGVPEGEAVESDALSIAALRRLFEAGQISDETPLRVQDPKGGFWQDWSAFGDYRWAYDGLNSALGGGGKDGSPSESSSDQDVHLSEKVQFWHNLEYRYKLHLDHEAKDAFVFGHLRQKVLHGHIDDNTLIQIKGPDGWGEWETLAQCKATYDGFQQAVGKKIAQDTLDEYRKAFHLFDTDGSGEIDVGELGTVMKALGHETSQEELDRMLTVADADGSGDIDFNEFISIMAERLHGGSTATDQLQAATRAYWALQGWKVRPVGQPSSEWICVAELQEMLAEGTIDEDTPIFTERFDGFRRLGDVNVENPDIEDALSNDYLQTMMYVMADEEQSEEINAATIRTMVRNGELTDNMVVWGEGLDNWQPLSDVRAKFGLAEFMLSTAIAADGIEEGAAVALDPRVELQWLSTRPLPRRSRSDDEKQVALEVRQQKDKTVPIQSAAKKLGALAEYAGLLCREEAKGLADKEETAEEQLEQLRAVIKILDKDNSGNLDKEEIGEALKRMGMSHSPEEVDAAFVEMDDDDSGEVGLEEFEEWFTKQEVRKAFDGIDVDGGGTLDREELGLVLKKLGKQLTEEGLNAMMTEIDIDGGGDVDFEEFFGWFVSVEAFLICLKSRITHNESTPHDRWQCDDSGAAAGLASASSTRMAKRWCVVVHVDGNGLVRRLRPTHPPAPLTWITRSP